MGSAASPASVTEYRRAGTTPVAGTSRRRFGVDQARRGQRLEVLAGAAGGHPEVGGDIVDGRRFEAADGQQDRPPPGSERHPDG